MNTAETITLMICVTIIIVCLMQLIYEYINRWK